VVLSPLFRPVGYGDLAGWDIDDHLAAFGAFRRSAFRILAKPYRTGALGVDAGAFSAAFEAARNAPPAGAAAARQFFERHFAPARIATDDAEPGYVTDSTNPRSPRRRPHSVSSPFRSCRGRPIWSRSTP